MFTFVFVALALFASTSQAMPTLQSRQAGGCANLGPASLFNASEFTLSAWYTTQSNDNSTGVPLAFRYIPSAGVNGETFGVISVSSVPLKHQRKLTQTRTSSQTVASTDPDVLALYDTQTWNLTNGALLPNGPLPGHVVDLPVTAGKLPVWALGTSLPPPADIYCALVSIKSHNLYKQEVLTEDWMYRSARALPVEAMASLC